MCGREKTDLCYQMTLKELLLHIITVFFLCYHYLVFLMLSSGFPPIFPRILSLHHTFLTGYSSLFFRNHLKDCHYVSTGWVWYMHLSWGSTTFLRIVRSRGFFFGSTTICWLFQCFCPLLFTRWSEYTLEYHVSVI